MILTVWWRIAIWELKIDSIIIQNANPFLIKVVLIWYRLEPEVSNHQEVNNSTTSTQQNKTSTHRRFIRATVWIPRVLCMISDPWRKIEAKITFYHTKWLLILKVQWRTYMETSHSTIAHSTVKMARWLALRRRNCSQFWKMIRRKLFICRILWCLKQVPETSQALVDL